MRCIILSLIFVFVVGINVDAVHAETMWTQGPLGKGDFFEYDVCKNNHRYELECFNVYLNIVDIIYTDISDYYAINAEIIQNNQTHLRGFMMDVDTFEIKDIDHVDKYAGYISDTIFWLGKIAPEINLEPGETVAKLNSYFPEEAAVMVHSPSYEGDEGDFVLTYTVFKTSEIIVNKDIPLIVNAEVYSPLHVVPEPRLVFTLHLINHSNMDNVGTFAGISDGGFELTDNNLSINEDFIVEDDSITGDEIITGEDFIIGDELPIEEDIPIEEEFIVGEDYPIEEEFTVEDNNNFDNGDSTDSTEVRGEDNEDSDKNTDEENDGKKILITNYVPYG